MLRAACWPCLPDIFNVGGVRATGCPVCIQVRESVIKSLKLRNPRTFVQSFNRTNLLFRVEKKPDKAADAMKYVAEFIKKQNTTTWGRCEQEDCCFFFFCVWVNERPTLLSFARACHRTAPHHYVLLLLLLPRYFVFGSLIDLLPGRLC